MSGRESEGEYIGKKEKKREEGREGFLLERQGEEKKGRKKKQGQEANKTKKKNWKRESIYKVGFWNVARE